jgi:hypothetical protein
MLRLFYRWVLRFHPARFRERFAEEMLSIFDHVEGRAAAAELVADAFISLVRQWTVRSEYWEEKAPVSEIVGSGGLPGFYTLESFKPRKSALIEGAVLTWIVYSALFLAIRHSKIHSVYVPSISFDSAPSSDVQLPPRTLKLPPTQASVRPSTEAIINSRANSPEADRQLLRRRRSSVASTSAEIPEPQEQVRLTGPDKIHRTITTTPSVQSLSQPFVPRRIATETLYPYVGVYTTDGPNKFMVLVTADDGQLMIEIPGEQRSMMVPVTGTKFAFSDAHNNWIEFLKQDNGAVYGLHIYRNGSEFTGRRKTN